VENGFREMEPRTQFDHAIGLRNAGHYRQALEELSELETLTSVPSEKAIVLINKSACHAAAGNLTEAKSSLREALKLAPDDRRIVINVDFHEACLLEEEGEYQESVDAGTRILQKYREVSKSSEYRFIYERLQRGLGLSLTQLGEHERAIPILEEAASFDLPLDAKSVVYCHLGLCYHKLGKDDLAIKNLETARSIELTKGWEAALPYYLGYSYFRKKQFDKAKEELTLSQQKLEAGYSGPPLRYVYEMLGYVFRELGQPSKATTYFSMAKPS
jgi:tetratricopeptide (TPR) repeat protein